eukprot:CCRYP_008776-RA/>CCRYP_008776-RA protein AED:0.08 eAED:0.08 QI:110/1/1/1/0/0.5/2/201/106
MPPKPSGPPGLWRSAMRLERRLVPSLSSVGEKVEEDRYIRAREKQIAESRHRAAEAEAHAAELAAADKAKIAAKNAAMHEIADLLAKTGDVVSEGDLPFFTCDQSY